MNLNFDRLVFVVCTLFLMVIAGCATQGSKHHYSSVVEYLYPKKAVAEVPSVPQLSLPLRVGVVFVPEAGERRYGSPLSEKTKMDLMNRISSEFRKLPFVKDIEIIPSAYLTPHGGFTNLDQIQTMYGVDVVALLSYDQVQHTDQGMLSISYWTIVGAYMIKGELNDTSTMLDAAVFDIRSRKMLFRAPGISQIKGSATIVNLSEQLRADALEGFRIAADDLVVNLTTQLDNFKAKVKEKPQEYKIEHQPGYTGGGSLGGVFGTSLLVLGGLALWRSRKQ